MVAVAANRSARRIEAPQRHLAAVRSSAPKAASVSPAPAIERTSASPQLSAATRTQASANTAASAMRVSLESRVAGSTTSAATQSIALPQPPLARGSQGQGVKQLQDALVKAGTLTQEQMNTGPGTFGPRTESAVKAFQTQQGLPATGQYDVATRDALDRKLNGTPAEPPPPPAGGGTVPTTPLARGSTGPDVKAVQDNLVTLGYLTQDQVNSGPGIYGPKTESAVRKFQLDHGMIPTGRYDGATAEWMQKRLAGESAPPPPPPGTLPQSAAEANRGFITQFTSAWNPTGPSSSTNCGPASLAMLMNNTGKMPAGMTAEQQVDYARALMYPTATPTSKITINGQEYPQLNKDRDLSGSGAIKNAINNMGGVAYDGKGWDELDAALKQGHPVVGVGYYSQKTWGKELALAGSAQGYQNGYAGGGSIGHFNTIVGMTPEGKYIVGDPMYTGGTVEMTREQLSVYFAPTGGQPSFLAFGR